MQCFSCFPNDVASHAIQSRRDAARMMVNILGGSFPIPSLVVHEPLNAERLGHYRRCFMLICMFGLFWNLQRLQFINIIFMLFNTWQCAAHNGRRHRAVHLRCHLDLSHSLILTGSRLFSHRCQIGICEAKYRKARLVRDHFGQVSSVSRQ